jgi:hypothetical protein
MWKGLAGEVGVVGVGEEVASLVVADEAEDEGTTVLVAVEAVAATKKIPDLESGKMTSSRGEPVLCTRAPNPEKKEKAKSANLPLHVAHHAPSSRGVLLSAPMADVSPSRSPA